MSVATHLNFTKAAQELLISQPAVTKHISEIERQTGLMLFVRHGRGIELTHEGEIMLQHARRIFAAYRSMEEDLGRISGINSGLLLIGASTTISQYWLPKILAKFKKKYPNIDIQLFNGNTEDIEKMLLDEKIDIGMIEGNSNRAGLHYEPFHKDNIVLVAGGHKKIEPIEIEDLPKIPLVVREHGSGTLEVLLAAIRSNGINPSDLDIQMHIGSTEGIKRYVLNSDAMAFVSESTIEHELKLGILQIVKIKRVNIERTLQFIRLQGQNSQLSEIFIEYASNNP